MQTEVGARFRMGGCAIPPLQFFGPPGTTSAVCGPVTCAATGETGDHLVCLGIDTDVARLDASLDGSTGWTSISTGDGLPLADDAGETLTFYLRCVFLVSVRTDVKRSRGVLALQSSAAGRL